MNTDENAAAGEAEYQSWLDRLRDSIEAYCPRAGRHDYQQLSHERRVCRFCGHHTDIPF